MHTEWITFTETDNPNFTCRYEVNGQWVTEPLGEYSLPFERFDKEEKDEFLFILNQYQLPENSISQFLDNLAEICYERKHLDEPGAREDKKQYANRILNHLEKTLQILNDLSVCKLSTKDDILLFHMSKISGNIENSINTEEELYTGETNSIRLAGEISRSAQKARPHIQDLTDNLKKFVATTKKHCRPKANSNLFYSAIGESFLKHFHETPTKNPDGPFYKIVKQSLEIIGLPSIDPSRGVEQAIEAMNKSKNDLTVTPQLTQPHK